MLDQWCFAPYLTTDFDFQYNEASDNVIQRESRVTVQSHSLFHHETHLDAVASVETYVV